MREELIDQLVRDLMHEYPHEFKPRMLSERLKSILLSYLGEPEVSHTVSGRVVQNATEAL